VIFPHPPAAARAALDQLAADDPDLASVEVRAGPPAPALDERQG
jgi:hypothetical protein